MMRKVIAFLVAFSLLLQHSGWAQGIGTAAGPVSAFAAGAERGFRPMHMRYLGAMPDGAYEVVFARGDDPAVPGQDTQAAADALMRYFRIGVQLPDSAFWVNLRPDAPQEVIDPLLEQTDMGRIMLEADLQLKKDLARMTDPATIEGRKYWDKLYRRAEALYGSQQDMEIPTLSRPWIVPKEVIIASDERGAYVYKATLKVMLEQDWLQGSSLYHFTDPRARELNAYAADLLRTSILPRLSRDVNTAKRYAPLRQVYYSLVLAQWYKRRFPGPDVNSGDVQGLTSAKPWSKKAYFDQYCTSLSRGEYNKQEAVGLVIRQYSSGGLILDGGGSRSMLREEEGRLNPKWLIDELGEKVLKVLFPAAQKQKAERQNRLEGIKEQNKLAGWRSFLEWEHGLALFRQNEEALERMDDPARFGNLQTHEIQESVDSFLRDGLTYLHTSWQRRDEGTNPRSMQMENVVLLRVISGGQTYVAVISVQDLMRDDVLARQDLIARVKEFRSQAVSLGESEVPALDGHEQQTILLFQGRPGAGKSTGIKALMDMSPGLIERFNPGIFTHFDGETFTYDWQKAADDYLASGEIPSLAIDVFVNELLRIKYSGRIQEADRLFYELLRLKDAYPQLEDFIGQKTIGTPSFIGDAADMRSWLEVAEKLGPDPRSLQENSPWTLLFTNEEIMSVEQEANRAFEQIHDVFVERGVSFIDEGSGLNKERELKFSHLEKRHLFSVRRVVYKIEELEIAVERVKARDKWADVMRNGIHKKRFEGNMREYYDAQVQAAHQQLEKTADWVIVTDTVPVNDSRRSIQEYCRDVIERWQGLRQDRAAPFGDSPKRSGIDRGSAAAAETGPQGFAERVATLTAYAYQRARVKPYDLARVLEGMLPDELRESMREGDFEELCAELSAIANDVTVNEHIRAEAISALSNAYRQAVKNNYRPATQAHLFKALFSLAKSGDGLPEYQFGSSRPEDALVRLTDKRVGYLLLMSLATAPERLRPIVENDAVGVRHRLYAAMLYVAAAKDADLLQERLLFNGRQMTLTEAAAELIRRESTPERRQDYELFGNGYLQDEELAVYSFAVWLQVVDTFPVLFSDRSFVPGYLEDLAYGARAAGYAAEADASLLIGGEPDFLSTYDFWGMLAHEFGHHLLPDPVPGMSNGEWAIYELMCELAAAAVSDHVGFDVPALTRYWEQEYHKGLVKIGDDFHRLARGQAHLLSAFEYGYGDSYRFDPAALFMAGYRALENHGGNSPDFRDFVADMIEQSPWERGDSEGVYRVSFKPTSTWVFPGAGSQAYKAEAITLAKKAARFLLNPDQPIIDALARNNGEKRSLGVRSSADDQAEVGGIDFRRLPNNELVPGGVNAAAWQQARADGAALTVINASLEERKLPADALIRAYVLSCSAPDRKLPDEVVRATLARICWLEEELGAATSPALLEALQIIASADPVAALQTILNENHA